MMESFGIASVAAITVIAYLIGMGCKASEHVRDNVIPVICGVSGAALGIIAYATKMPEMADMHILTAIAVGTVSGLAATGINQVYKQATKEG